MPAVTLMVFASRVLGGLGAAKESGGGVSLRRDFGCDSFFLPCRFIKFPLLRHIAGSLQDLCAMTFIPLFCAFSRAMLRYGRQRRVVGDLNLAAI